jgi:hypothetical protein
MTTHFPESADTYQDLNGIGQYAPASDPVAAMVAVQNAILGGTAGVLLDSGWISIADADVKALVTTPYELVAAPGATKFIMPLMTILHLDWTADYTNIDAAAVLKTRLGAQLTSLQVLGEAASSAVTNLLAFGTSAFALLPLSWNEVYVSTTPQAPEVDGQSNFGDEVLDQPLQLFILNNGAGDLTGGDAANVLRARVLYYLVDIG